MNTSARLHGFMTAAFRAGIILSVGGLFSGCSTSSQDAYFGNVETKANVFVAPVPSPITKVAVMPFRGPTELIGASVADMFVTDLLRTGRYELLERSQMANVLSETELAMAGLSASKAVEVGAMLGADGVIIGTVDEYSTVAYRGRSYPVVGITARLIDVQSGKVMWSVDLASRSESKLATLSEHGRQIVHEMTAALYQNWRVQKVIKRPRSSRPQTKRETHVEKRAPVPPPAPVVTGSDMELRQVTLSWSRPNTDIAAYEIERAAAPEGPYSKIDTVSSRKGTYADSRDLSDGTTYYYRLIAVGENGLKSPPSSPVESMTAPPPDPPDGLTAEAHVSRGVRLEWKDSTAEGVVSYIIERSAAPEGDFYPIGETKRPEFIDGGHSDSDLTDNHVYRYRILAVNRVEAIGAPSQPVTVRTLPPPDPVVDFQAASDEVRCVPLTWKSSKESDIDRYEIYRSETPDGDSALLATIGAGGDTAYLDGRRDPGNLEDAHTYYYTIIAVNKVNGRSDAVPRVAATTRPPPPQVRDLQAQSGIAREVSLRWAPSPDERVTGYEIYRSDPESADFSCIARIEGRENTTYRDRGGMRRDTGPGALADETIYRYRVTAFNTASAHSDPSEEVAAVTKAVPSSPKNVSATERMPRRITIAWAANASSEQVSHYIIESSTSLDGRFRLLAEVPSVSDLQYVDAGLPDGVERYYRIKAVDSDTLESAWSTTLFGSTKSPPDPPTEIANEWTKDGACLQWKPPPQEDISEYKIWKKKFLGWDLLATLKGQSWTMSDETVGKKIIVALTSVDEDGIESQRSDPFEVRPPDS